MARVAQVPYSFTSLPTNLVLVGTSGQNIIDTINLPVGNYNIQAFFTAIVSGTVGGTSTVATSVSNCTGQIFTQLWSGTATAPANSAASATLNQSFTTATHLSGAVYVWTVDMNVVCSGSGTVQFQALDSIVADTITFQTGSYCEVIKVA